MALTAGVHKAFVEGGAKTVVTRALRKITKPALKAGKLVFIECDLTKPLTPAPPMPEIECRIATRDDVTLFEDQKLFLERFHEGHHCFMGIEKATGKLTNYRWVNTTAAHIPELRRYLLLQPGEAYVYDLNTLPEFRRRGIDVVTRYYTYSYLRDHGFHRILAYIHGDNHPSLKASKRLLNPIGNVWFFQLRGCDPLMMRVGPLRTSVKFSERS